MKKFMTATFIAVLAICSFSHADDQAQTQIEYASVVGAKAIAQALVNSRSISLPGGKEMLRRALNNDDVRLGQMFCTSLPNGTDKCTILINEQYKVNGEVIEERIYSVEARLNQGHVFSATYHLIAG